MSPITNCYREALLWMASGDTGVSSKTLLYTALLLPPEHGYSSSNPSDPFDLGRCIRLIERYPWVRDWGFEILSEKGSNAWKNLIKSWDRLTKLYYEELPSGFAPRTYSLMQELIQGETA